MAETPDSAKETAKETATDAAPLPTTARVVVIGGGIVGASVLYHLAKAGWTDCLLLERQELTAGSTWHAAGNVPTFSTAWSIMAMQHHSTRLYARLGEEVGSPIGYHRTGSIRLAHSRERLQEFAHVAAMGRGLGIGMEVIGPAEAKARYPFLELHDLAGALHDPEDGDIDPAQVTQALATGARAMGARILRFTPATGIARAGDEWIVRTERGEVRCEIVVNAAGYEAARVGAWFLPHGGRPVPMAVMSHQYLLTGEIPELVAHTAETGAKLPLLRDVDSSYYLRQEKHGFNLGPYERNCRARWATPDDPMPEDFSFQLYADELDRLDWHIEDAVARVPLLGTGGVSRVINGPIPYTPDGNPLIGPMPGVPNAFEACVFTFGIAQGGGAGRALAEWITEGAPEWDLWSCDPRRFTEGTDGADPGYCVAKAMEVYGHEYAMHFPRHRWPAGADRKVSPVHARVTALGGRMRAHGGWERADWFAKPGDDTFEAATRTWGRAGPWEPRVREECEAVRDGVGVIDLPGLARFALAGSGAAEWLLGRIAGALPEVGRIGLACFADHRGRILSQMSVMRFGGDDVELVGVPEAELHDHEMLRRDLPGGLALENRTRAAHTLLVTGPGSRALLAPLCEGADLGLPWLSVQGARVAGEAAILARISMAGELGWEIHLPAERAAPVHEALLGAGARPVGMVALDSLRLEKGYRAWKRELSTACSPLEAGLGHLVRLDKPQDFPGKAPLVAERARGPARRLATLVVEAGECDAPPVSMLWHGGRIVGETTSGGWGYRVGASIALGMLPADLAVPGTRLEVGIFGERVPATVQEDRPLWDPEDARLRA